MLCFPSLFTISQSFLHALVSSNSLTFCNMFCIYTYKYTYLGMYDNACIYIWTYLLHVRKSVWPLSFWAWLTSLNIMFHPFTCKWQNFILLYKGIKLHCRYIHHILNPFLSCRASGLFHSLVIANNNAMSVQISIGILTCILLDICLRLTLLDHIAVLLLVFEEPPHCFQ
jgi:hypothetical protein